MSSRDSWIKFHQWWQEHLKFHFVSSSSISDDHLTSRRCSLISYRSTKNSQLIKIKKRSSCGGIDERQLGHNDFRHVRDSIRGKNPRTTRITSTITTNKRPQFRKSTTCDISSEEISSHEKKKSSTMNKIRENKSRRFSLVKFEFPTANSNVGTKDERKMSIPSSSHNLLQKLLFRQFSPKTRPCSLGTSSDENVSSTTVSNESSTTRRSPNVTAVKPFWPSSKQNVRHGEENVLLTPSDKILSKSEQSDLDSYLSKRRNTTGSISLQKIVDLKNSSNVNTLRLVSNVNTFNNSNHRISNENIFQTVEDLDFLTTKQLINTNENIVNSYNEYDWCPLDIAIMLNNIPMIRLLLHYGANESYKIQPEASRYESVCQQLSILSEQNPDEFIKKSSSNKLAPEDTQFRRLSPSCEKQQRHRRTSKCQQHQLNQQRSLTLSQMKTNYEQSGRNDVV